jgi:hypothetical protein
MMDKPTIIKLAELADLVSLGLDGLLWREPMAMSQELHDRLSGLQWRADEIRELLRPFHDDGGTWDPPRSPLRVVK